MCFAFCSSGYLDVSVPQVPDVRSALPQSFHLVTVGGPYKVWVRRWEDCGGALLTTTAHYRGKVSPFGHPRIKACLAAPRGLSQPATSFVGVFSQGIHHVRFQCPKNRRTNVLDSPVLNLIKCNTEKYSLGAIAIVSIPYFQGNASRRLPKNF